MESPHGLDLQHMLESAHSSFLSLAATNKFIFSGSQSGNIHVWDRHSLKPKVKLRGHAGSVLALEVVPSKEWLFSSSGTCLFG
jgi:di- and tripeptidase